MMPVRTLGPVLLLQGLTVNRRRPDLESLARETRPERFVWRVLLAIGGVYLAMKLFRGLGQLFWTVFGLALGFFWMFDGRLG